MSRGIAVRCTVLVTGNPGSGKTTMVTELTRLGYAAVDADLEVAGWESGAAGRLWMWDRGRLEKSFRTGRRHNPCSCAGSR